MVSIGLQLVLALATVDPALAPPRAAFHAGLPSALEAAAQDGALVLAVFGADWCPACRALKEKVLSTPEFAEQAGLLHVAQIDADKDQDGAKLFRVKALPSLFLLTAESKIVARSVGFKDMLALLDWIEEGRRRVARGAWDGVASDGESAPAADLERAKPEGWLGGLVERLGDPDPARRRQAAGALADEREEAVPFLIKGMADPHLAVRIGACEILARLAPGAPAVDPWAERSARDEAIAAFTAWWKEKGELPPPEEAPALSEAEARSARDAIAGALSTDPFRRTEAMSGLVALGAPILPELAAAIEKCAARNDQRSVWVLEDVRWAILIPDPLEGRISVRRVLARGTSEERQAAVDRLAGAGAGAFAALRALAQDQDPMVCERTLYALTRLRTPEALAVIGGLLSSKDSNLRMVAAQQLGRSRSGYAAKHLVDALDDPDEVVASVAIAAFVELRAAVAARAALPACLKDPRWRVRAAAAEAIGKLKIPGVRDQLFELFGDPDPFVIKSAVEALRAMGQTLSEREFDALLDLAKRSPDLTGPVTTLSVYGNLTQGLARADTIFEAVAPEHRYQVIERLDSFGSSSSSKDEEWRPILEKALASPEPAVRRAGMAVLGDRSIELVIELFETCLADESPEVRALAMEELLRIAADHWGVPAGSSSRRGPDWGVLELAEQSRATSAGRVGPPEGRATESESKETGDPAARSDSFMDRLVRSLLGRPAAPPPPPPPPPRRIVVRTGSSLSRLRRQSPEDVEKRAPELREMHARWHRAVGERLGDNPDIREVMAYHATGDGVAELPLLARTFGEKDLRLPPPRASSTLFGVLVKRLTLPEGRKVLELACASPRLYSRLVPLARWAQAPVRDYLLDPERVAVLVESSEGEDLEYVLGQLALSRSKGSGQFSTLVVDGARVNLIVDGNRDERADRGRLLALIRRLCGSRVGCARALGTFLIGTSDDAGLRRLVEAAAKDADPWVRRAAVQSMALVETDASERSERFAPFLADQDLEVVAMACAGLLDRQLWDIVDLENARTQFRYRTITSWDNGIEVVTHDDGERSPESEDRRPAYLDQVRRLLADPKTAEHPVLPGALAVLLAQHGDHGGLRSEFERWARSPRDVVPDFLLYALSVTRDRRYLPAFRAAIELAPHYSYLEQMRRFLPEDDGSREIGQLVKAIDERIKELKLSP